ncbi:UNVERIFIED_CONTAM: 1-aminocyclopropane-1-carboxylate synthase 1 [Sesamum radiatum]|uniref:1-aminocyclopropane-1-carboxylate synthase 1 n=1 Tax=Sesamum radiatum TaxID=300843 RepID=A0AAW2VI05_SESRA
MELIKSGKTQLLSKIASSDEHGENSPYFDGWKAYDNDPYHPPKTLMELYKWALLKIRTSCIQAYCIVSRLSWLARIQTCCGQVHGKVKRWRVSFDPDRIVMAGGATGANEMLMFCLADPGDAFLIPSPYYAAFDRDLGWRPRVRLIPVACHSFNDFQITLEALEAAYESARKANINVKGLILANPSNPLGTTLDRSTLRTLITFINHHQIHLVCDEIYAATVFRGPSFLSVSEIIQEMECNRDLIHIVYSLSKDMGLPGFRVGIVYSYNDTVVNLGRKMSSFGLVSSQTQYFLASMLSDEEFMDQFLSESVRRLASRHDSFTKGLEEVGIKCLKSNAGLFCWMDLRYLLKEPTFEGEMGLWKVIISDVKLNVSPGLSFHCHEPGWFRVCFANMDDETVEVALRRIRMFVGKYKEVEVQVKKSWQRNLRLSFPTLMYDEDMAPSPHMMSPHSPIPQSPLVRART